MGSPLGDPLGVPLGTSRGKLWRNLWGNLWGEPLGEPLGETIVSPSGHFRKQKSHKKQLYNDAGLWGSGVLFLGGSRAVRLGDFWGPGAER